MSPKPSILSRESIHSRFDDKQESSTSVHRTRDELPDEGGAAGCTSPQQRCFMPAVDELHDQEAVGDRELKHAVKGAARLGGQRPGVVRQGTVYDKAVANDQ